MEYMPLKMQPCFKDYLWGGNRLKYEFGKKNSAKITAESWEFSAYPDGLSVVENGVYAGKTLKELSEMDHRGFFGTACGKDIPLLVKMIDAEKDLSIQVHPSDQTALSELGERGKAEMWYIVDCVPQSSIYYGFSRKVSEEEFLQRAKDGSICDVLNRVPVRRGDVFYILPGTIHAIGKGIVIAEIQQSSNTTFRVYDYQRRDDHGNLRALHLERATRVLNYEPIVPEECKANSGVSFPNFDMREMFSCQYFRAYRFDVKTSVSLQCTERTFHHVLCVEGTGEVVANGTKMSFQRGDSFMMPAAMGEYTVQGVCRMLLSCV